MCSLLPGLKIAPLIKSVFFSDENLNVIKLCYTQNLISLIFLTGFYAPPQKVAEYYVIPPNF